MTDTLPTEITSREVIRLAVPGMLFAVLTHGYRTVDQYWIQGVSTEAQAAIGSSFFVLITFFAAFELVAVGAGPLVARATGAGDPDERRQQKQTYALGYQRKKAQKEWRGKQPGWQCSVCGQIIPKDLWWRHEQKPCYPPQCE